ncbi:MAG: 6-carboxytetrahydropterin synthase QueD [Nitrospirae bacterium]|nr:6-carboxytetrahydropterin synthase QueD [Nitrospirota bacterium]MBF0536251.1 6-carboxytetrahydropterin synthase QueD [Nitrospirota bacterium]MBF0615815.1 6-carboxytetrahydropterin synthase QueD [Nitrospirota bacterium]
MFELSVESTFAAAHQLRGYKGKCEALHGHNWRVQVVVQADKLNEIDIAVDFHDIKKLTKDVTSQLDHAFLNDIFPFTQINPSSENIAKWIYDTLRKKISTEHARLLSVTVWESETAAATYYED